MQSEVELSIKNDELIGDNINGQFAKRLNLDPNSGHL